MPKTITVYEFEPGRLVDDAAAALVTMARVTGERQVGEFNDKLLVAYPRSTIDSVLAVYWGRAVK